MGVEPFLISSTINIVLSQRLVRMLCPECKIEKKITGAEMQNLKRFLPEELLAQNDKFYMGKGCSVCGDTGYRSRIGIHEVLEMSDAVRELVMKRANASQVKKLAVAEGMITMLEDGFQKAVSGVTTIEEVLRVFHE